MNDTMMTVPMKTGVGESLAFLAFPAKRASQHISAMTEEIVRTIISLRDQLLGEAMIARTRDAFRAAKTKNLGQYMQVMIALSELIDVSLDSVTIERLTSESLTEMEAAFQNDNQVFGKDISEQAAFTVWTLGKINDLIKQCNLEKVSNQLKATDIEFSRQYVFNVLHARFHLDCLYMSLTSGEALFPEVLEEIAEGLRGAVDAYAWVRHGLELRHPSSIDEPFVDVPWDEEQNTLMHESSSALLRESY